MKATGSNLNNMTPYRNSLLSCSTLTGSMGVRVPPEPKFVCEICGEVFDKQATKANHVRWKHIEPFKPADKKQKSQKWLEAIHAKTKRTDSKIHWICPFCGLEKDSYKDIFTRHKKYCEKNPERVEFKPHSQSEETRKKLSEIGLKNNYRRLMRKTQEYHGILYDSSWEVEMAKKLESLGENFERPKEPINYIGADGKQHHYFPDFWIPKLQKFIEVKNPYLYENDNKVQILKTERRDIIWVTSLEQILNFSF